ncbi:hypothetical protein [Nostoc sp. PCC 9305]|uniref:hypothetical protein n=1 Tax=Nostoc sp. PCC 9305 TaxID=296636 RepID=UPI0039C67402
MASPSPNLTVQESPFKPIFGVMGVLRIIAISIRWLEVLEKAMSARAAPTHPSQTETVDSALRLGCDAIACAISLGVASVTNIVIFCSGWGTL